MLIPSIDCKLHKRFEFEWIIWMKDLNEYPFVLDTLSANHNYEGFKMYIDGEMWQNLKQFFEKNAW